MIKSYTELSQFTSFEDRFEYLKLNGHVGEVTFGWKRYLNQVFYRSDEWKKIRRNVILRDNGCDLGVEGFDVMDKFIVIHHMNPLTSEDIENRTPFLISLDYLISCTDATHKAIHYGNKDMLIKGPVVRTKNDTIPWR